MGLEHDDDFEFQCSVYDLYNPREHHDRSADINKHDIIDLATSVDNIVNGRTNHNYLIARDDCHAKHVYVTYRVVYYCPDCDVYGLLGGADDVSG